MGEVRHHWDLQMGLALLLLETHHQDHHLLRLYLRMQEHIYTKIRPMHSGG